MTWGMWRCSGVAVWRRPFSTESLCYLYKISSVLVLKTTDHVRSGEQITDGLTTPRRHRACYISIREAASRMYTSLAAVV